tara:strand:- start:51 stop:287 length:237 start_codon:yes stop_codon:yes gene_type:complete
LNKPTKSAKLNNPLGNYSQAQNDIKNFDKFENSILLIARFFFQANDEPNSQAWKFIKKRFFLNLHGIKRLTTMCLSSA